MSYSEEHLQVEEWNTIFPGASIVIQARNNKGLTFNLLHLNPSMLLPDLRIRNQMWDWTTGRFVTGFLSHQALWALKCSHTVSPLPDTLLPTLSLKNIHTKKQHKGSEYILWSPNEWVESQLYHALAVWPWPNYNLSDFPPVIWQ